MAAMRLIAIVGMIAALPAFAQRVVAPDAPWKKEKPGGKMSGTFLNGISDLAPPINSGEFVRRQGSVLTIAGKPFRFNGNNLYFNQADIVYGRTAGVEEALDKMAVLGMTVTRSNAHNDNAQTRDPAAIQLEPNVYSETSLVALDRSIALAKARNIRLILKITNNWDAYGGIRRYVGWHLGRTPIQSEWGLFYTEPAIKSWFRNYIRMLIDRKNTITGITYREEPAILAWELGNELRNPSVGRADALVEWTAEMAAFIKLLDSNHLVADGGEGFDDAPNLYPGLSNRYTVSGSEGCSYHRLVQIPDLDMVSYHLYPAGWGMNDGSDSAIYIRRHEELAREAGKVAYMGEFGKRADDKSPPGCARGPGRAFDPERAGVFQSWLGISALEQASSGVMVWQLINDGKDDCEGFQVYCPEDAASCHQLRLASEGLASSPVMVSAASFRTVNVAAGSIATLFGKGLAGAQVTLLDAKGVTHTARQFFNSAEQINLQIPEAVSVGAAVLRVGAEGEIRGSSTVMVSAVEPGIFAAAGDGRGLAAGLVVLVQKDGSQQTQAIARYDPGLGKYVAVPIAVPMEGTVVLSLFGTGIRGHGNLANVSAKVKGISAEVLFAGAQGEFAGLDQVNVELPKALAGLGEVDIELKVSGKLANIVRVELQ